MAIQSRFCGNCGRVLAPGATFCGRCGAPVPRAAAIAAYPTYAYPHAPAAAGRIGAGRTAQIAVAAGLVAVLIVVAAVVGAFAIRGSTTSHQTCTANCSPKIVTPLKASATYTSSAFKYELDYSDSWTVESQDANGITLATDQGRVSVVGMRTDQTVDQVIQATVAALPSATWQDVTPYSDLKGAHLGDQNGLGSVYSANFIGSDATATKVQFAVIAAAKNGVTVVVFAVDPADIANSPNGMAEGQLFDYMCTEFRWGS